eukprot:364781-Chlamydomonas_euryale.AAC.2
MASGTCFGCLTDNTAGSPPSESALSHDCLLMASSRMDKCLDAGLRPRRGPVGGCAGRNVCQND